jgi:Tfp pilus assembly protein PilO
MNIQLSVFNRILIVGGIFVVIALLGWFFVFQPKKHQEDVTRAQIADLQGQYDELKRVADQKPLYLALTAQIRARLKGVELTADPRTYIPSYLKQIENLATQDGLIVTAVTPQATAAPSPGPSAAPGTSQVRPPNLPGPLAGTAGNITNALGARNGISQQTAVAGAAQTGVMPAAGGPQGANAAGQNPPSAANPGGVQAGTPRAAAIAYLNQSFTQVPIGMSLDGRYESLERFLRDLAKFQKLIGVGDVTMTGTSDVNEHSHLKITLPITAYRLSPNAPPGGPLATPTASPAPGGKR